MKPMQLVDGVRLSPQSGLFMQFTNGCGLGIFTLLSHASRKFPQPVFYSNPPVARYKIEVLSPLFYDRHTNHAWLTLFDRRNVQGHVSTRVPYLDVHSSHGKVGSPCFLEDFSTPYLL